MPRNSEIHFRLKAPDSRGKCLIYLHFVFNKQRLFYSFGQRIEQDNWNRKKERVKRNSTTTTDGQYELNHLLDSLERECKRAYNAALKEGIPRRQVLKDHLDSILKKGGNENSSKDFFGLLERFINNDIKHRGKDKSSSTIKTYRTFEKHLQAFSADSRLPISFRSIDLDFYYRYTSYLKKKGLSINAIAKDIQILKVVLREAVDLGLSTNYIFSHKKFTVYREDTDAVYLNENEILSLYNIDLSAKPRLERVRDLFVFGCFVGLRFSDYSSVKSENIVNIDGDLFIKMITKKTRDEVIIPCNPVVRQIFEKYRSNPNKLPHSTSNQKFNDYIKEVCREANLLEVGRLSSSPEMQLWQCISSHTARRSFATNFYLTGFPTLDLMKITGHKTEKAFMRYIRITKLDTAKRLNTHIKASWSAKLLRVVG